MNSFFTLALAGLFCTELSVLAQSETITVEERYLSEIPAVEDATFFSWNSQLPTRGLYYDGPEYQGKPTKVFAFLGIPEVPEGKTVPGIVLVHGGGGTAFREWVELWMSRGYAAIAMDLCGAIPVYAPGTHSWMRIPDSGGPAGWDASFSQLDQPIADQWPYYAVNAIARARTLLGSQSGVDTDRIAITGVSWGGYLTCITVGVDSRYVFAAPIYGCGFLRDKSAWMETLRKPEMALWNELCDPAAYLASVSMPILWVAGTNDGAYPLESLQKSAELVPAPVTRSIAMRMPHGHGGSGELPEAVRITADYFCKGEGAPLPAISGATVYNGILTVSGTAKLPVVRAELLFTSDRENAKKNWVDLNWKAIPAECHATPDGFEAVVAIPADAAQYILNVYDQRDVPASTRLFTVVPEEN